MQHQGLQKYTGQASVNVIKKYQNSQKSTRSTPNNFLRQSCAHSRGFDKIKQSNDANLPVKQRFSQEIVNSVGKSGWQLRDAPIPQY